MNVNEFYANIPADQHGNIAISAGAVSITQGKKVPVVLLKKTADSNADLTDTDGKVVDRVHLEANLTALKLVSDVISQLIS